MSKLFDTHSHYYDAKFDEDRFDLLKKIFDSNTISGIMCCGDNIENSKKAIELSSYFENMYASVGIHPEECENAHNVYDSLEEIIALISSNKVKAIGEIGLDYYWDVDHDLQKRFFDAQLALSEELNLPVIIHDRDAHKDTLDIIKSHKNAFGIMHCYSGSVDFAKEYLNQNFYISFGGPLTYKNNVKTVDVLNYVPLDRLLVETDAPYLPPVPHRGERNDSSYVHFVAEKICEIKNIEFDDFAKLETNNANRIFNIK